MTPAPNPDLRVRRARRVLLAMLAAAVTMLFAWLCWPQSDDAAHIENTAAARTGANANAVTGELPLPTPSPALERTVTLDTPSGPRLCVLMPDGRTPAVGASVYCLPREKGVFPNTMEEFIAVATMVGTTDADGFVALPAMTPDFLSAAQLGELSVLARPNWNSPPTPDPEPVLILAHDIRFTVRTIDARGRAVAGVEVFVGRVTDAGDPRERMTDGNGYVELRRFVRPEAEGPLSITARIPAREVRVPVILRSRHERVEVGLGDVGSLDVTMDSDGNDVGGDVQGWQEGHAEGRKLTFATRDGHARVPVATDAQLRVLVYGGGQSQLRTDVVGPHRHGEEVVVAFDLRRCRVRGVVTGLPSGEPIALTIAGGFVHQVEFVPDASGNFAVNVPRTKAASTFAIVATGVCAEVAARLDGAECDVGALALVPRPRLGVLEVRDERGALRLALPRPVAFLTRRGERIAAGASPAPLVELRPRASVGVEVFGLPCLSGVELEVLAEDRYATPAVVTVAEGRIGTALLAIGGSVTLRLAAARGASKASVWLQRVGAAEIVRAVQFEFSNEQVQRFAGLRPGDFRVHVAAATVSNPPITVVAGGDVEVQVQFVPR